MTTYTHTDARVGRYRAESSPDGFLARVIYEPSGRTVRRFTGETAHADAVRWAYDTDAQERFENR